MKIKSFRKCFLDNEFLNLVINFEICFLAWFHNIIKLIWELWKYFVKIFNFETILDGLIEKWLSSCHLIFWYGNRRWWTATTTLVPFFKQICLLLTYHVHYFIRTDVSLSYQFYQMFYLWIWKLLIFHVKTE